MTRIVDQRQVRDGYVKVSILELANRAGEQSRREVADFGDSVCVLPYDPDRKVALVVRLTRAPLLFRDVHETLVEAPAGMIEPGEDAEMTARREAMEEAGVLLRELEPVAVCWPSPGVLAERSHLFLARYTQADRSGAGGGVAAEHEDIEVEEMPLADLLELARAGALADMKTLTLVLTLKLREPELFEVPGSPVRG